MKALYEVLIDQVIDEDAELGVSTERGLTKYIQLRNLNDPPITVTFLGKPMKLVWPEGTPPQVDRVLSELVGLYSKAQKNGTTVHEERDRWRSAKTPLIGGIVGDKPNPNVKDIGYGDL